ncbi:MAG: ROK family protein [Planctomycetota bacterium]|jgi:allose kinase|nr:ROK family protein [Planctomycetota bacterium]
MADDITLAMDFSGETLTAGFVADGDALTGVSRLDLADFLAGSETPMEKLISLLAAKLRTAPGEATLLALAMGCDISADGRTVLDYPGAIWLNGKNLADALESAMGRPVVMERRGAAFLSYDRACLDLPQDGVLVGCYVDDVYDNAIWCGGRILRGHSGAAGNIGHMPVHGREDNCHCGKFGCIELYGTGVRLKQMHSLIFPDIPYEEIFVQHREHPLLKDFLRMMAYPIAAETNILDPDVIVLGGTVPSMPDFPIKEVEQAIRDQCYYPYPAKEFNLVFSSIDEEGRLLAAARHARDVLAGR